MESGCKYSKPSPWRHASSSKAPLPKGSIIPQIKPPGQDQAFTHELVMGILIQSTLVLVNKKTYLLCIQSSKQMEPGDNLLAGCFGFIPLLRILHSLLFHFSTCDKRSNYQHHCVELGLANVSGLLGTQSVPLILFARPPFCLLPPALESIKSVSA